ncbi:Sec23-binding domain of Sec16-domain-containing protein [Gilbertella persicaria]|uniref:Sec23-binding domain of Sec16-domain-containing protein n=1 Tax=Gilbertella persicaria TaxID=101096 RepID=UPI00221F1CF1|nr:Sec23-binding domain of Sec16-domain-containing protein [Gilbertella persicaria]KAI8048772.1 Sec23-binding domain of Sec16-domain-containing protein [Gilbertella persicaria]
MSQQQEWYQFDPNVHYYYDEHQQVHYYDPNTNMECPYPSYAPSYTPQAYSRQPTPDVLLPCPDPTCDGENKPTSKFCEECGRPLTHISRSATPASMAHPHMSYYPSRPSSTTMHTPSIDPLDRARGCPVVCWGFGGKMVVSFPRMETDYYTSTVKSKPGLVQIRRRKPTQPVLGPVLMDPNMSTKQKKKQVSQYMQHQLDLFEQQAQDNKILLWRLIKTMMETEGSLNDKHTMDQAILNVIRPPLLTEEQDHFSFPNAIDQDNVNLSDQILAKMEYLLVAGNRRDAVDYAVQEDLWAHALIISSCVDKQLWQQVIQQFVDREMNAAPDQRLNRVFHNIAGNNQALRVMYRLFSGAGASAMQEFIKLDIQHVHTPYGLKTVTPAIDRQQLVYWRNTVAIILANRTPKDVEALAALGDILSQQGWLEAAHVCYVLASPFAVHSGIDTPQVRFTLLGTHHAKETELSEIYEFVHSLSTTSTTCMPFLQGYKLAHAWRLADDGYMDEAQRYYEAIDQCIKTAQSPYLHSHLVEQLAVLGQHLEAATGKKSG